jgi:hypothetical protein
MGKYRTLRRTLLRAFNLDYAVARSRDGLVMLIDLQTVGYCDRQQVSCFLSLQLDGSIAFS